MNEPTFFSRLPIRAEFRFSSHPGAATYIKLTARTAGLAGDPSYRLPMRGTDQVVEVVR